MPAGIAFRSVVHPGCQNRERQVTNTLLRQLDNRIIRRRLILIWIIKNIHLCRTRHSECGANDLTVEIEIRVTVDAHVRTRDHESAGQIDIGTSVQDDIRVIVPWFMDQQAAICISLWWSM